MVKLIDRLYMVANDRLTHPWDGNAYLIAGDEPTLIDCGSSAGYPMLKRNLERLGYAPGDIRRVIATHCHWDHLAGMAQLRAESDAELWLHPAEHQAAASGDIDITCAWLYDRPFDPVVADRALADGEVLDVSGYRLEVFHTPGHSPGSVCLRAEIGGTGVLIVGDTLWGHYHQRNGASLEAWQSSLDRLSELEFDVMTSGHTPPTLIFDARAKVQEACKQFGIYFNPWFKPFYRTFQY